MPLTLAAAYTNGRVSGYVWNTLILGNHELVDLAMDDTCRNIPIALTDPVRPILTERNLITTVIA